MRDKLSNKVSNFLKNNSHFQELIKRIERKNKLSPGHITCLNYELEYLIDNIPIFAKQYLALSDIVEFVNQLRDQGKEFSEALIEAAQIRLRPIIMTGITTIAGSLPLILSSGAGSETRITIGIVILTGVAAATIFTIFVVPVAYDLLARKTGSPNDVRRKLEGEQQVAAE